MSQIMQVSREKEEIVLTLRVNGEEITRSVNVRQHLADFLRAELGLTGTHLGCEHGACGACTVRIDGLSVRSCLVLAVQTEGSHVETIEGLTADGSLSELQDAFVKHNALQCGFCTSGMLICALEFLKRGICTDRKQIRNAISGNYCRCTGYQAIVSAIAEVATSRAAKENCAAEVPEN